MANAQLGVFSLPQIQNEPLVDCPSSLMLMIQLHYAPNSKERADLQAAIIELRSQLPIEIPCIVDGSPVALRTSQDANSRSNPAKQLNN
jgi:1-pyrroline-5-carboxylate dehydrogenase